MFNIILKKVNINRGISEGIPLFNILGIIFKSIVIYRLISCLNHRYLQIIMV